MAEARLTTPDARPDRVPFRHVLAVFAGNGLEFYDFLTYAFFAVYIGRTFFPSHDASLSLLGSLGTFGAGFITRPIGAMVIGPLGDRIGRKPAMLLSFSLMGVGILGLCLTPSYARIGIAAPILVLMFRLLQGFALGGEVGPTTAYMIEASPPLRRGFYGSMQNFTQNAATALAGIVGWMLSLQLSDQQLQDWGWRAAMGLGVLIVPFGLWLRRRLPETMHAADDAALAPDATRGTLRPPLRERIRPHLRIIVCGLMLIGCGTIGYYTINYMTTYALSNLHLSSSIAFGATIVSSVLGMAVTAGGGWMSDRLGRRRVIRTPLVLLGLLVLPTYLFMNHYRDLIALYTASAMLAILLGLATAPIMTLITEQVPRQVRSGVVATLYAFAVAIFGGSTQFVETWLVRVTGSDMAPAFYWLGAILVGIVAVSLVRESAPVSRRDSFARVPDASGGGRAGERPAPADTMSAPTPIRPDR